jgi:hypothetical protein
VPFRGRAEEGLFFFTGSCGWQEAVDQTDTGLGLRELTEPVITIQSIKSSIEASYCILVVYNITLTMHIIM